MTLLTIIRAFTLASALVERRSSGLTSRFPISQVPCHKSVHIQFSRAESSNDTSRTTRRPRKKINRDLRKGDMCIRQIHTKIRPIYSSVAVHTIHAISYFNGSFFRVLPASSWTDLTSPHRRKKHDAVDRRPLERLKAVCQGSLYGRTVRSLKLSPSLLYAVAPRWAWSCGSGWELRLLAIHITLWCIVARATRPP